MGDISVAWGIVVVIRSVAFLVCVSIVIALCSSSWGATVTQVSAGAMHTVALMTDGTVWVWGRGYEGQMGDGIQVNLKPAPARVPALSGVTAVSAGGYHTLALKGDGTVWMWGRIPSNSFGTAVPTQVQNVDSAVAISAGDYYSAAVKSDGTVLTWGNNSKGQLGDGTTIDRSAPVQVVGLSNVARVSTGSDYAVAIKRDGTVWTWGKDNYGQLGDGAAVDRSTPGQVPGLSGAVAAAAGVAHTLVLRSDGTVWAFGRNSSGQLGDSTTTDRPTPIQVPGLANVVKVSAGDGRSAALTSDGTIWTWGSSATSSPAPMTGLTGVVTMASGSWHTVAVTGDGTVYSWGGFNWCGELGNGTAQVALVPTRVRGIADITAIDAGYKHATALRRDGTVWSWGDNTYGELGDGTNVQRSTPVQVPGITDVVGISAGHYHTLAVKSDGTVYAWGLNQQGELGDGTTTNRWTPTQVSGLTDVVAVSAGYSDLDWCGYSLAVKRDGTVWGWGSNACGELGIGSKDTNAHTLPVRVGNYWRTPPAGRLNDIVGVSAGFDHALALKADGSVWAWGGAGTGEYGDAPHADPTLPTQIPYLTDVAVLAAAGGAGSYDRVSSFSLAARHDGTMVAWGQNGQGQLGNYPVTYSGTRMTGVTCVAAGSYHSLATSSDGSLWAWGDNYLEQTGNAEFMAWPSQVSMDRAAAVSAGHEFSLVLRSDGTVWSFGNGYYGELGNSYSTTNMVPTAIQFDTVAPTSPSVSINGGAVYTPSRTVTVSLSANDDSGLIERVPTSWDGIAYSAGGVYAPTKTYTLPAGDGRKTLYVKFRDAAGNESAVVSASIVLGTPGTLLDAKASGAGSPVSVNGGVVTAVFVDGAYVESANRTQGVKLTPAPEGVTIGSIVDVAGAAAVLGGEKIVSSAVCTMKAGSGTIAPLGVTNFAVGGGDWLYSASNGTGQLGVSGWQWVEVSPGVYERQWLKSQGVNNIGLLVRTCGAVTEVEPVAGPATPSWFKIDDGSDIGLKVSVPVGVTVPEVGSYATVTGISSCEPSGGDIVRLLRVRMQSDITP